MKNGSGHIIISTITVSDTEQYAQVYELREAMLRKPIGLSLKNEDLSGDAKDIIVIAEQDGMVGGCVMIQSTDEPGIVKLRQMAVTEALQGTGIGRLLVAGAEKVAREQGHKTIKLHARITAEGFYKKLDYRTISGIFTEVGIPHVVMEKELN